MLEENISNVNDGHQPIRAVAMIGMVRQTAAAAVSIPFYSVKGRAGADVDCLSVCRYIDLSMSVS